MRRLFMLFFALLVLMHPAASLAALAPAPVCGCCGSETGPSCPCAPGGQKTCPMPGPATTAAMPAEAARASRRHTPKREASPCPVRLVESARAAAPTPLSAGSDPDPPKETPERLCVFRI